MYYDFDKTITKTIDGEKLEYGFITGNEKILFIKVGAGEDIHKYQDHYKRYVEMAVIAHKWFGVTVICASNPDVPHEDIDEEMIRMVASEQEFEDFKLYLWGISDGAYHNLKLAKRFPETVKIIGVNTSFITFSDLEDKLQDLSHVKKILIYGSKDYDFDIVFPALRDKQDKYLKMIFIGGADHSFSEMAEQLIYSIELIDEDTMDREVISFGRYWSGTGMENVPIEWIVLDEDEDNIYLLSKQSIVTKMRAEDDNGGWEHSSIRKWLNNEFIQSAFNEHERLVIINKEIITTYDEYFKIPALEETTTDKVFLLSKDDLERYFTTRESIIAEQSRYAINTLKEIGWCDFANSWWLRNGGKIGHNSLLVLEDGMYNTYGSEQYPAGIRPAMYIRKDWLQYIPVDGQMSLFNEHDTEPTYKYPYNSDLEFEFGDVEELLE